VKLVRAAYIEQFGPPEVIRYGELPAPTLTPTDVLVDVAATTVNHVDTFIRAGSFRTPLSFPFVVGRDLIGTVSAVGPGVAEIAVGDEVWANSLGHSGRQGAAARQVAVPAGRVYRLPQGVSAQDAVAVAHPAATAYLALFTHGRLRTADTVIVAGAAGNVGSALVSLAVHAGARVIATANDRDVQYCHELGATEVLDYRDPQLRQHLSHACPNGADLYLDTFGENNLTTAVSLLARGGRIILLAGARSRPVLPVGPLYMNDCSITGFVISHATSAELAEAARTINGLLAGGRLRPRRIRTLPLSSAGDAHRMVESGETRGTRLVLSTA
jgi:NADPH:quinone reductase-like Zn-dependent oxidoreductase